MFITIYAIFAERALRDDRYKNPRFKLHRKRKQNIRLLFKLEQYEVKWRTIFIASVIAKES